MIAPGYYVDMIIWECLYFSVFILSSVEICLHRRNSLKSRVKILQRVWFPAAFVTSIAGCLVGIDLRGAFGIQTRVPVMVRVLLFVFTLILPACCALVFVQQLFLTTSATCGFRGPFNIGQRDDLQVKVLIVLIALWVFSCTLSGIMISLTNRLIYGIFILSYGVLIGVSASYLSSKMKRMVEETSETTSASLMLTSRSNLDSTGSTEDYTRLDSKFLSRKMTTSIVVCYLLTLSCLLGIGYLVTWGREETIVDIISPNPQVYFPSVIIYLLLCIPCFCLATLGMHGVVCCCTHQRIVQ
jgi:hypothetical protein